MRYLYLALLFLVGCGGIPPNVQVVQDFQLPRYLGTWYEIARLDHRFERGLVDISAEYRMRNDGGVMVLNSGYNVAKAEWQIAEGVARFVGKPDVGQLEVSFFGPFYGAYNIIALDKVGYRYVMIAGPNFDYLWILSRTPQLEVEVQSKLVEQAKKLGFATDQLIYDQHAPAVSH